MPHLGHRNRVGRTPASNPCVTGLGSSQVERRDDAELLQHPQHIPMALPFHHLAVGEPAEGYPPRRNRLVRRWDAGQLAGVRRAYAPAHYDGIPFGDLFLDGEVDIGEGRHVQLIVLLEAFGSMW
jgi:hypothetical protein